MHDLDTLANGQAAFAYNLEEGLPWHNLGTGVQGMMTAEAAISAAGLDTPIEKRLVYVEGPGGEFIAVADRYANVRTLDGKPLGIVGKDYKIIQNRAAFEFFDMLVDSGEAKYDTAGALNGGRRIFLTAKIGDDIQVAGQDPHQLWLALLSSHDGSRSLTAMTTIIRIVCANTETMALKGAKTSWTMTHRTTLEGKVAEARDALKLSFKYGDAFSKEVEKLLQIQVTTDKFREIMTDVLPDQKRQLPKNLEALTAIYENSPTINDAGAGGTGWGAFNAVSEWLTHGREVRSQEARMVNTMWGWGHGIRNKTHDRILELV